MYYPHLPTSKPTSLYYRLPAKRSFRDLYFWRNNEQQMMTAFVRLHFAVYRKDCGRRLDRPCWLSAFVGGVPVRQPAYTREIILPVK